MKISKKHFFTFWKISTTKKRISHFWKISTKKHVFPTFWKIPKWLYKILRKKVYPVHTEQKHYPILFLLCRCGYLFKRALDHLRFMDFSLLPGTLGYILWKLGVISFWKRFILKRYHLQKKDIPVGGVMPENMNVQKVHEKKFLSKHQTLS